MSKTLFNNPLGVSTPVLLNKRTRRACKQPHEIHTYLVLRVDLVSNLDLVSRFAPLSLIIKVHASVINDYDSLP
jgi:hypothetical protein